MRTVIFGFLITCTVLVLAAMPAGAQPVTADDARSVAQNWVALTIRQQGDWGGSPTAQIGGIQEFRQGDRLVGYFCPVSPQGFIVVSLRRELAPVKAYSDTSNLGPDSNEGMAGLIKLQMAAILDEIEKKAGPIESVSSSAVTPLMEFNYLGSWDVLDTGTPASESQIQAIVTALNYQEGGILLTTEWHQGPPYNNEVPAPDPSFPCKDAHCAVGCTATAGVQIMAYWDWPPAGIGGSYSDSYDWPRMANRYDYDSVQGRWEDENGNPLIQANLDAVSELSHEVGVASAMQYCANISTCESGAWPSDLLSAYKNNFRYASPGTLVYRRDYTSLSWFSLLREQFNRNWPVVWHPYPSHVVAGDGWREFYVGTTLHREFHINYGWGGGSANAWYALEGIGGIPGEDVSMENILINIYPAPALGWYLSGTYPGLSYPYRYFDADARGDSASFSAGHHLQFLPGITATCNSGSGTAIRFDGSSSANTRLFTRGDTSKGAVIRSGTIKLKPGGSVRLP